MKDCALVLQEEFHKYVSKFQKWLTDFELHLSLLQQLPRFEHAEQKGGKEAIVKLFLMQQALANHTQETRQTFTRFPSQNASLNPQPGSRFIHISEPESCSSCIPVRVMQDMVLQDIVSRNPATRARKVIISSNDRMPQPEKNNPFSHREFSGPYKHAIYEDLLPERRRTQKSKK